MTLNHFVYMFMLYGSRARTNGGGSPEMPLAFFPCLDIRYYLITLLYIIKMINIVVVFKQGEIGHPIQQMISFGVVDDPVVSIFIYKIFISWLVVLIHEL